MSHDNFRRNKKLNFIPFNVQVTFHKAMFQLSSNEIIKYLYFKTIFLEYQFIMKLNLKHVHIKTMHLERKL